MGDKIMNIKNKKVFITGIPTSGKSYLARQIVLKFGYISIFLDDLRKNISVNDQYRKWTNFYSDKDEKTYLTKTSPEKLWQNLVEQSEGLWPAYLEEIEKHQNEN